MLVIIGGSGMLFEASRTLVEKHADAVLLCARRASRYQPILAAHRHARFFRFDFSAPEDYARLCQRLDGENSALTFLAWIHSPYYAYFNDLLDTLGKRQGRFIWSKGVIRIRCRPRGQTGKT